MWQKMFKAYQKIKANKKDFENQPIDLIRL